jgi:hypothetical protein
MTPRSCAKNQVVVRRVDNHIDGLLDEFADDYHDARCMNSLTSASRFSSSSGVALAIPLTPIDSMASDAQATPQATAS